MAQVEENIVKSIVDWCKKKGNIRLCDYLRPSLISFLNVRSRDEAIGELVKVLLKEKVLEDDNFFFKAVLEREKIVSTGIGMGVAIPHAKLKPLKNFFIAIGVQKGEGLDWNSLDATRVKLIFLIGGPEKLQTEYLKILSKITLVIKDEGLRKKILRSFSREEILKLLQEKEASHGFKD